MAEEIKEKKKLKLERIHMPKQDHIERVKNFDEVALGYPVEAAVEEASRCLNCKKPLCNQGCPVGIDIRGFIELIMARDFSAGVKKIKETNALPAICGRVCPQEEQCEKMCVLANKRRPVAIGRLERFLADWEAARGRIEVPVMAPKTGRKVAVIGAGPAGMTVANDLALPRPRSDHLRSASRVRRRPDLRHPRVPPARRRSSSARWIMSKASG